MNKQNEVNELTVLKFKTEQLLRENISEVHNKAYKDAIKTINTKLEKLEGEGYTYKGYYTYNELEIMSSNSEFTIHAIEDKKGLFNIVARHLEDGSLVCKGKTYLADLKRDARVIACEMKKELEQFGCYVNDKIIFSKVKEA